MSRFSPSTNENHHPGSDGTGGQRPTTVYRFREDNILIRVKYKGNVHSSGSEVSNMPAQKRKRIRRHTVTEKDLMKNSVTQRLRDKGLPTTLTLLDLRGSVPVPGPQDFDAIRQQVMVAHNNIEGVE